MDRNGTTAGAPVQGSRPPQFICDLCGRERPIHNIEEALAEYHRRYPEGGEKAIVCDDCHGWMFDENFELREEHLGQAPPWTVGL